MLNRLKVSQKVLIAPLAVLIVLLAFATLAFITVRGQLATTNRLVDETHAASLAAENLVTLVSDSEPSRRPTTDADRKRTPGPPSSAI